MTDDARLTEAEMAMIMRRITAEIRVWGEGMKTQLADQKKTIEWQRQQLEERMTIVANGVDYLVADRKKKKAANAKRGTENQVKGNTEERDRAAADMEKALKRVHDDPDVKAGKHGAILAACRHLCDWTDKAGNVHHGKFKQLSPSKKYGDQWEPLTGSDGEPIKPETIAKNYRERYGTKKPRTK